VSIIIESHIGSDQLAMFLDIDPSWTIHHDLGHFRIVQEALYRSVADHLIEHVLKYDLLDVLRQVQAGLIVDALDVLPDEGGAQLKAGLFAFQAPCQGVDQVALQLCQLSTGQARGT
jgi:hypothetical protein